MYSKKPMPFPQGSLSVPHLTGTSFLHKISNGSIPNSLTSLSFSASISVTPKRRGPLPSTGTPFATCSQHPGMISHSAKPW
ncbi:hypothetical protein EBO34_16895 [Alteribacter keqinensis]|uniref:Uncharacterized protein n=1 Tax=Alteribacter keqinensis TaxID=2483800 RepID=A0A3M7TR98_9BACI|nr:hypothetical protein EBO34_16895 [Alteribacter keqinensis]